jgi:reverse transcriptase-like protein
MRRNDSVAIGDKRTLRGYCKSVAPDPYETCGLRTDVKSYYASIEHLLLLDQFGVHIKYRRVLNLIGQYLRRTSERGGSVWDYEKDISLGCPLRPLIVGFFLNALDAAVAKLRLFYVRFMDDILILAPTRWQLRGAVKVVNQMLGMLRLATLRVHYFVCKDSERRHFHAAEARCQRHVGSVAAGTHHDASDPLLIVTCVAGMPLAGQIHFEPSGKIHRRTIEGNTDVAHVSCDVPCGNIHATAQGERQVREIPADALFFANRRHERIWSGWRAHNQRSDDYEQKCISPALAPNLGACP